MTDNNFDLLVFDWDGTLMDSQARIVFAMRGAITDLALPERNHTEISMIIGLGMREAILHLFPTLEPDNVVRFIDAYRDHFLGDAVPSSVLFAGVEEMLSKLRDDGIRLAVATGKSRKGLDREFHASGLGRLFDASRCADEAPSKPHPAMLEELMDELSGEPKRTLMIGDTAWDLEMAANAGISSVGVTWGAHAKARLLECNPLACFDKFTELADWLNQSSTSWSGYTT